MEMFMVNIFKSAVKQMGSLLCIHLITLLPGLIVTVLLLPVTTKFKAIELVVSALFVIIYFSVMFVSGWRFANRDIRPHNREEANILKGFLISISVLLLNFVLWVMYWFSWKYLSIDGSLVTWSGFLYNALFIFDTIFISSIGEISKGNINLLGNLLLYLVPFFSVGLGYILGYKNITFDGKFDKFVYEKKDV